ncbi:MAG: hypothetical protein WA761_02810, partial [Thermoplasmata archaeon]
FLAIVALILLYRYQREQRARQRPVSPYEYPAGAGEVAAAGPSVEEPAEAPREPPESRPPMPEPPSSDVYEP